MLLQMVDRLCAVQDDLIPIEWLLFPMNAAHALFELANTREDPATRQRDQRCAALLRCYAMALHNPACKPAQILNACHPCPLEDCSAGGR